jgi:hypothetical protein
MSDLRDDPDLMMEIIAKLVQRAGGHVRVTGDEEPKGPFDLLSRIDAINGIIELSLSRPRWLRDVKRGEARLPASRPARRYRAGAFHV